MEISKMLTISTAHVSDETLDMLDMEPEANKWPFLGVYPKAQYGYFIYIDENALNDALSNDTDELPKDLFAAIMFALSNERCKCDILCLDDDGEEIGELSTYWSESDDD